jgi:enoyl-CoA hydratase
MRYETIEYVTDNKMAIITFNRPETLNAINYQMLIELKSALAEAKADSSVRVVVCTGRGKSFIAGGDIKAMNGMNALEFRAFCVEIQKITRELRELGKPVIAAINGWALGGGCEIACACDIRIAAETAVIGLPEPRIGLTNTSGVCHILPRLVGLGKAIELACTGTPVDANEAYRIGLVNQVVPPDTLLDAVRSMADDIIKCSPVAVQIAKETINVCVDSDINTALHYEVEAITTAFTSEDRIEGFNAFLEKRPPRFSGK